MDGKILSSAAYIFENLPIGEQFHGRGVAYRKLIVVDQPTQDLLVRSAQADQITIAELVYGGTDMCATNAVLVVPIGVLGG